METCNCSYLCPCVTSNLAGRPTEADCKAAIAICIDKGVKDDVNLDGLSFIVMLHSPGVMSDGNISVGLTVVECASDEQVEAISAIAAGSAGGPMAALGPLVGGTAGVERRPIQFEIDVLKRTVRAGDLVDQPCEGVASGSVTGQALALESTVHPVNPKLFLAKATRSLFNVFGIKWDDSTGTRNAHFTTFSWAG